MAGRWVENVRFAVQKRQLTPLDGARVMSVRPATLFGYEAFILAEVSPESLLAAGLPGRWSA